MNYNREVSNIQNQTQEEIAEVETEIESLKESVTEAQEQLVDEIQTVGDKLLILRPR
jgi:peptidoglycan hydrolase CwlO-like protein